MYKPSIQSIVLPSIYEHKVGESKFLDEESKQTEQRKSSKYLQRSTSHFDAISTRSPAPYATQQALASKAKEDYRKKVQSTTRPTFHIKNGKLLILGK